MLDPVAIERAERQIDQFINAWSKDRSKANEIEEMRKASERRHHARQREKNRWAWIRHFEHMRDLHQGLADEHQSKAAALLEGRGEGLT